MPEHYRYHTIISSSRAACNSSFFRRTTLSSSELKATGSISFWPPKCFITSSIAICRALLPKLHWQATLELHLSASRSTYFYRSFVRIYNSYHKSSRYNQLAHRTTLCFHNNEATHKETALLWKLRSSKKTLDFAHKCSIKKWITCVFSSSSLSQLKPHASSNQFVAFT